MTQADSEAELLHRQLDLSGIIQWSPATGRWSPGRRPAKVYVVNLWSIHCKPCIDEFPIFKNIVSGWRTERDVQFLFIADPPTDTTEAEFIAFWRKSLEALPNVDPYRSTTDAIRAILETEVAPVTLLLDAQFIVRQAFVGTIEQRRIGNAIERLLKTLKSPEGAGKMRRM